MPLNYILQVHKVVSYVNFNLMKRGKKHWEEAYMIPTNKKFEKIIHVFYSDFFPNEKGMHIFNICLTFSDIFLI